MNTDLKEIFIIHVSYLILKALSDVEGASTLDTTKKYKNKCSLHY